MHPAGVKELRYILVSSLLVSPPLSQAQDCEILTEVDLVILAVVWLDLLTS